MKSRVLLNFASRRRVWDSQSFLISSELRGASRHQAIMVRDLDIKCCALLRCDSLPTYRGTNKERHAFFGPLCLKDAISFMRTQRIGMLSRSFRVRWSNLWLFSWEFHDIYANASQPKMPKAQKDSFFFIKMVMDNKSKIKKSLGLRPAGRVRHLCM